MKIALCQMDIAWGQVEQNLRHAQELLEGVEADMAILPEMFATGYCVEAERVAEPAGSGRVQAWLRWYAAQSGMALVATVAVAERKGEFFNRLFVALPSGEMFAYDKRHLFSFAGEHNHFSAGKERIIVEYKGMRILPLVCYDLRFPAWSYMPAQADLIIYTASWAASRSGAWNTLLPARAIENQAYVVGVNRVGEDNDGTHFAGHSACYDFMGRKIASVADDTEGVAIVELSKEAIEGFTQKFRAWADADRIEIK